MIYNLQYMRALAALLVVLYHGQTIWNEFATQKLALFDAGAGGVDVFFVISGYVITRGFIQDEGRFDRRGAQLRDFMWRRAARIIPVYLAYVLVNAVLITALRCGLSPDELFSQAPGVKPYRLLAARLEELEATEVRSRGSSLTPDP